MSGKRQGEVFDVCGIPAHEYLDEGFERLRKLREEIVERIDEMGFILEDMKNNVGGEFEMICKRADSYWLGSVSNMMDKLAVECGSMVNCCDTLHEIRKAIDDVLGRG